jgi:hypothetical protein
MDHCVKTLPQVRDAKSKEFHCNRNEMTHRIWPAPDEQSAIPPRPMGRAAGGTLARREIIRTVFGIDDGAAATWDWWLSLTEPAGRDARPRGTKQLDRVAREAERRGLLPLGADEEGLPPHVVALVDVGHPERSRCINSYDLDNLVTHPDLWRFLASEDEPGHPEVSEAARFLAEKPVPPAMDRLLSTTRPARAEQLLRRVVETRVDEWDALLLLLGMLDRAGRLDDAVAVLDRPEMRGWTDQVAHDRERAGLLSLSGKPAEGAALLRAAVASGPVPGGRAALETETRLFEAMAVGGPLGAAGVSDHLAGFLAWVREDAGRWAPAAESRALEEYCSHHEGKLAREAYVGAPGTAFAESLGFLLYFAFAYRPPGSAETPAERAVHEIEGSHFLRKCVNDAVRGPRRGAFEITDTPEREGDSALIQARDTTTRERLDIGFTAGSAKGRGFVDAMVPGTVLRALLVPWAGVWFIRGTAGATPPDDEDVREFESPRVLVADGRMTRMSGGEGWVTAVFEPGSGFVRGVSAEAYPAPAHVFASLRMACGRVGEPDVVMTRGGFPFWDGREGSLLKRWTWAFGVRHVVDDKRVNAVSSDFWGLASGKLPAGIVWPGGRSSSGRSRLSARRRRRRGRRG